MTLARPPKAKAFAKDVFINQERKLEVRRRSDTALVLTVNDANQQSVCGYYYDPTGNFPRETYWVFGLRGEYGCKIEI